MAVSYMTYHVSCSSICSVFLYLFLVLEICPDGVLLHPPKSGIPLDYKRRTNGINSDSEGGNRPIRNQLTSEPGHFEWCRRADIRVCVHQHKHPHVYLGFWSFLIHWSRVTEHFSRLPTSDRTRINNSCGKEHFVYPYHDCRQYYRQRLGIISRPLPVNIFFRQHVTLQSTERCCEL